jgi:6-phosphogluconolactonase/glucosamine-6-phosphate isomerase/deaminase
MGLMAIITGAMDSVLLFGSFIWLAIATSLYELQAVLLQLHDMVVTNNAPSLLDNLPWLASVGIFARSKISDEDDAPQLAQEKPGFYLDIASDVNDAGRHAAYMVKSNYDAWMESDWGEVDSQFKYDYFTIAVGGGNTVKSEYRALLDKHAYDIDWIQTVRFFFLEESSGDSSWESSCFALAGDFIRPLAGKLISGYGASDIAGYLGIPQRSSEDDIVAAMLDTMVYAIDMTAVDRALGNNDRVGAKKLARAEARRYQASIATMLGERMSFHMILSGIAKDGGIGAFSTYTPELKKKDPAVVVLDKANGALVVALNRGVLTAADCISLIISGSLKLKALGRFEMQESAEFEQTVMETPIRMLRESRQIAEKVFIFADDRALHFDEGLFQYQDKGKTIKVKSEVREGQEEDGVHIFLIHGFMGLYSYINMLIRLPSAWKVSAMHRGKHAKQLPDEEIFPHYAHALRKAILQNWRYQRPTPVGYHSIAGVISDHLLLSVVKDYDHELPEFEQLKAEDQQLIEALRSGGLIHMASWAPTDVCHIAETIGNLKAHMSDRSEALDYGGPQSVYNLNFDGDLELNSHHCDAIDQRPAFMEKMMRFPATELMVNVMTSGIRYLLNKKRVQKRLSSRETPYALRIIGSRLLKKISFYGLLKEVNASLHDPYEYQRRHFLAMDAIIKYDIPYLAIIHKDDFMVSANRHSQEHQYLSAARMAKEGVEREQDLQIPTQFVLLEREEEQLPIDPLNPHLMLMSTSHEGDRISREVTTAITHFVNGNVAGAVAAGMIKPLGSVTQWSRALGKATSAKAPRRGRKKQETAEA